MDSDLTFVRCILCVELKAFFQTSFPSPSILHSGARSVAPSRHTRSKLGIDGRQKPYSGGQGVAMAKDHESRHCQSHDQGRS